MNTRTTTTRCHAHGHKDFVLDYDPLRVLRRDVEWLRDSLESSVASGHHFAAGQTMQIGWMITRLEDGDDTTLRILEPDFRSFPITWDESVTMTLAHLRCQKAVCESLGLVEQFPSIRESCLVGIDLKHEDDALVLKRSDPAQSDSGWFIGAAHSCCDYSDPANLRRCSLYEAALLVPESIMFLALPAGCGLLIRADSVQANFNAEPMTPLPGSFLDQWRQSR